MSKRFFVSNEPTGENKYQVMQQDSETQEPFGVEDFETLEEAQSIADGLQSAVDNDVSENPTGNLPEIGEISRTDGSSAFADTPQDLKNTTSQE